MKILGIGFPMWSSDGKFITVTKIEKDGVTWSDGVKTPRDALEYVIKLSDYFGLRSEP